MTDDLKITPQHALALTQEELATLDAILATGDRGGFYQTYYAMTGSSEANLQTNIATFSGLTGAAAFGANRLDQAAFGPGTKQTPQYAGIYYLSQQVALQGAMRIREDAANNADGGNVSDGDFFATAGQAWAIAHNIPYFPENALDPDQLVVSLKSFLAELTNYQNWNSDIVLNIIRANTNPGALVSSLAVFAALPLGKGNDDFEDNPNYDEITTPGGALYVNKNTGKVAANFHPDVQDAKAAAGLAGITAFFVGTGYIASGLPGAVAGLAAEVLLQNLIRSVILALRNLTWKSRRNASFTKSQFRVQVQGFNRTRRERIDASPHRAAMNIRIPPQEDRLSLEGLETTGMDDTSYEDEIFYRARSTVAPPRICPQCGADSSGIHRHGVDEGTFKDVVGWNKMVSIIVARKRWRCTECSKTWIEKIPSLHERRMMTVRLEDHIAKRCLTRATNMSIAREHGIDEGSVRSIFKEFAGRKAGETPFTVNRRGALTPNRRPRLTPSQRRIYYL